MTTSLHVNSWGFGSSVRDGGRLGRASLGVSRGGAVDLHALQLANRLVGNRPDAAGIETSGALMLIANGPVMVAVAGALAEVSVTGGPPIGWGAPALLPGGARVSIGRLVEGLRCYVAVRGGVIADGAVLWVGADPATSASTEVAPRRPPTTTIRVWPGPRLEWFAPEAWSQLVTQPYAVSMHSDRVGARLSGPSLATITDRQLPSEGMVEGAIQVPPDGQPIVMLADHPTTGGYPVIAVVDPADIGHVAQAVPGSVLRFRSVQ